MVARCLPLGLTTWVLPYSTDLAVLVPASQIQFNTPLIFSIDESNQDERTKRVKPEATELLPKLILAARREADVGNPPTLAMALAVETNCPCNNQAVSIGTHFLGSGIKFEKK